MFFTETLYFKTMKMFKFSDFLFRQERFRSAYLLSVGKSKIANPNYYFSIEETEFIYKNI